MRVENLVTLPIPQDRLKDEIECLPITRRLLDQIRSPCDEQAQATLVEDARLETGGRFREIDRLPTLDVIGNLVKRTMGIARQLIATGDCVERKMPRMQTGSEA